MKTIMSNVEQERREYFKKLYTEDPAKHWVRVHGWLYMAQRRLQTIRSETRRKSDFAKYFTFPGEYAVDVLLLAENGILQETKVGFPGVAYCERRPEIVSVITKKLGRCMGVFAGSFEETVFRSGFQAYSPFDIINLDLTKEIFPLDGRPESNTIRAIERLLWLHKNRGFDLYVTFKSSLSETNPNAVEEFKEMIKDNFTNNETLKNAFVKNCGVDVEELLKRDFSLFWCKSFPKWILETGLTNNTVGSLEGECIYLRKPRYGKPYHIITFLFSFKRKSHGLMSKHKMVTQTQKEILKSFTTPPVDVDEYLSKKGEEKERLRQDAMRISKKPPKIALP